MLSSVRPSAVGAVLGLPVLLFFTYARLLRTGVPLSRLINPGAVSLLALTVLLLAALSLPQIGRPTVVVNSDWAAGRRLLSRRWRCVPLTQVDRFCQRTVKTRFGTRTVLTVSGPSNERVTFSLPAGDLALPELVGALQAAGATQVPPKALRAPSAGSVAVVAAYVIAAAALPVVYLEIGPLRLRADPGRGPVRGGCHRCMAVRRRRLGGASSHREHRRFGPKVMRIAHRSCATGLFGRDARGMARIEDFRAVVCVLRTGSVTEAARELGRSQPGVTRSLQRLEEDLGIQLFRRRPTFAPTALGAGFRPYAESVVAAADQALAAVAGLHAEAAS